MGFERVMVTGATGMLGSELVPYLCAIGYEVQAMDSARLNLLGTQEDIDRALSALHPQVVIHAAAYTAVDAAEREAELAMAINKDATRKLALAAKAIGAIFVYVSTDFVFDGLKTDPYMVGDRPNPISVYGLSKYYGELMVAELLEEYYIIRTSWLYGISKRNFVHFVLDAARQGQEVRIATDTFGTPTWTGSLCDAIHRIMTSGAFGIHHASDAGVVSRYDQATAICEAAGLSPDHIRPCLAEELALPATRPRYSALDCGELPIPAWTTALQAYLEQYHSLEIS
ncbi:MAG: dTDP-4-dehydrorhamnose reductase [Vampirovibrionales bacterium]|nr:dTDP-4-dehydrorhamnose reductase [Vampirovibrionales bacterium]